MPKNINGITIIIALEGIDKIKTKEKKTTRQSEEYFFHQRYKAPFMRRRVIPGKRVTLMHGRVNLL